MDTKFCGKSHPSLYNHPRPPRPFFMFFLELVKLLARSKIVLNHSPEVVVSISNFYIFSYIFYFKELQKLAESWQKSLVCLPSTNNCHRLSQDSGLSTRQDVLGHQAKHHLHCSWQRIWRHQPPHPAKAWVNKLNECECEQARAKSAKSAKFSQFLLNLSDL